MGRAVRVDAPFGELGLGFVGGRYMWGHCRRSGSRGPRTVGVGEDDCDGVYQCSARYVF